MLRDLYLFAGLVFLAAAVICVTVHLFERWLLKEDKPRLRRALRVHKVRRSQYEPHVPRRHTVYPDGRERAMEDEA